MMINIPTFLHARDDNNANKRRKASRIQYATLIGFCCCPSTKCQKPKTLPSNLSIFSILIHWSECDPMECFQTQIFRVLNGKGWHFYTSNILNSKINGVYSDTLKGSISSRFPGKPSIIQTDVIVILKLLPFIFFLTFGVSSRLPLVSATRRYF